MNHRIIATLGAFVLLLLTAVPALGHDAIASCGALQLINGTPTAGITRTDVDPDVLVRDDIPGTGTQTGLAAGIYSIEWDDGFTVIGKVVTACEQLTEPTPTPTPTPTPFTPPDQHYPCTSNPAVFGPPCPEPTPTPTPLTSPSPSASIPPSAPPSATPVPTPDVPTITLPPTDGTVPDSGSTAAVGIAFTILSALCLTVLLWPKRVR